MSIPIHVVAGTRPELHKLHTIVVGLAKRNRLGAVLWSGQHTTLTQAEQSSPPWNTAIDLAEPASGDPVDYAHKLKYRLLGQFAIQPKGPIVVQGDTATAFAGALAGLELGWKVYHVEAGIRTGVLDDPWPEEIFRREIDGIADGGNCATVENLANLENRDSSHFAVTGNPGLDRSLALAPPTPHRQQHLLVTLHRRESFGERLAGTVRALVHWATYHPSQPVLWPVHPNPEVQRAVPTDSPLILLPPLEHRAFLQLLSTARAVVTDSGGVQEEAAAYGIPAVVVRRHTDRPESISSGHALLAPDPDSLSTMLREAMAYHLNSSPSTVFGDGKATERILDHLETLYPAR